MGRTYKTLSLSLHPDIVGHLRKIGEARGLTAARVAAEMVVSAVTTPGSCSFCGKSADAVRVLFADRGAKICDQCVSLIVQIVIDRACTHHE